MTINFKQIFKNYVDSQAKVWVHNRSLTVGASEIGSCQRGVFFKKNNYPKDSDYVDSYGATFRGDILENNYVVPALRGFLPKEYELKWAGKDQTTLESGKLSATPDGLVTNVPRNVLEMYGVDDILSDCFLCEIKSFDSRLTITEPKEVHIWQVQQQMGLVHELTEYRPEYAVILYVNAAWVDDIRPFVVKRDQAMYDVCKIRANNVYDASSPEQLPPEGKLKGGKECAYCPYVGRCGSASIDSMPADNNKKFGTVSVKNEDKLRNLVSNYTSIGKKIKQLTTEKTQVSEELKQFLRDIGNRSARTSDGYGVTYSSKKGRKKLDLDAITADGVDLNQYYIEGEPSEMMRVSVPNGDDDE